MTEVNFNNKTFYLLGNSANGKVDSATKFYYKQDRDLVTADYYGGTIVYGKIIARHCGDSFKMIYQCYTLEKELKTGKATAKISMSEQGKIKLDLNWKWLDSKTKGTSTYIEI